MNQPTAIKFIRYESLFNEPPLTKEQCFVGLSKRGVLLMLINLLNNNELTTGSLEMQNEKQMGLLRLTFQKADDPLIRLDRLLSIEENENVKFIWIVPHTCLEIIDHLLVTYSKEIFTNGIFDFEQATIETKELFNSQIINFIKGYFSFSNTRLDKISSSFVGVPFREIAETQFTERIGTAELENRHDLFLFNVEFIKSIEFFGFIESKYEKLLNPFLEPKGLDSWEKYVLKISEFMSLFFDKHRIIAIKDVQFFDSFTSYSEYPESGQYPELINFKSLKKFPLIKYADNKYLTIFKPFAFEKIYKTLYFDLALIAKSAKIKFDKGILGREYFEGWLCPKFINRIFRDKKIINVVDNADSVFRKHKDSSRLKTIPDQYIRNWNDVFVFEFKDVLIADKVKVAYDKKIVLEGLEKSLLEYEDKKGVHGVGVLQLTQFIVDYNRNHDIFDPSAIPSGLSFYPILIVQDRCLSTPGINQILNFWFDEEMAKHPHIDCEINRLIIMNINSLVNYINLFEDKPGVFKKCLLEYIKFERKAEEHKLLLSFDSWMGRVYLKKENRQEDVLNSVVQACNKATDKLRSHIKLE